MEQIKKHFNRLSEIGNNTGIQFSHYGIESGCHCPMHTALASIKKIKGLSSLVVGMPECGYYSRFVMDQPVGDNGELHYSYILSSNEVVFGCRDGLKDALIEMVSSGAKAIMIIMTCIPALIGEDMKEIAEEIKEETLGKAVCIDMAHFKRKGYEAGFYELSASLLAFTSKKRVGSGQKVNILGPLGGKEGAELKDMITENGYEVLEVSKTITLELLDSILNSQLSIVTSLHMLPLAKALQESYKVPFVFLSGNYDIGGIDNTYQAIFKALHIESDMESFTSYQLCRELIKYCIKMQGVNFIIPAILSDVLGVTAFLCSLKLKPLFIHIEEYNQWMEEWKNEILNQNLDPITVYLTGRKEICNLLDITELDKERKDRILSLGTLKSTYPLKIIRDDKLQALNAFIGYERTVCLLKMMKESMEEKINALI